MTNGLIHLLDRVLRPSTGCVPAHRNLRSSSRLLRASYEEVLDQEQRLRALWRQVNVNEEHARRSMVLFDRLMAREARGYRLCDVAGPVMAWCTWSPRHPGRNDHASTCLPSPAGIWLPQPCSLGAHQKKQLIQRIIQPACEVPKSRFNAIKILD
ncbi:hypothetical protein SS50377_20422 [Spironucleus salmonicida]|uniref:FAS1 domain-containing protein n=1 Tax=Spironucleus salmonicida TaxID=348837 RepID=V6LLS0_9EUKA|nr:hypothetical protein SS50377_20422 [Spironucleus salmonicida]|eukprot:EST45582.1 Hypothetical protein SS50377_jh056 [Spironucleus salmonicida]